jgi:hypothetical protein
LLTSLFCINYIDDDDDYDDDDDDDDVENGHKTQDGWILLLNLNFQNNGYTIVNVYSPNTETERVS